jgi:DNA-binding NarL/FixJ family response regulator
VSPRLRVVIAEDDVLLREGIARLLADAGFEIVGQAGDAEDFLRKALAHRPDVAVVDIQMPPNQGADGLRAALELRARLPTTGVLALSSYCEESYALDLIGERAEGVGYLLKERVGDVEAFIDARRSPTSPSIHTHIAPESARASRAAHCRWKCTMTALAALGLTGPGSSASGTGSPHSTGVSGSRARLTAAPGSRHRSPSARGRPRAVDRRTFKEDH